MNVYKKTAAEPIAFNSMFTKCLFDGPNFDANAIHRALRRYGVGGDWAHRLFAKGITKGGITTFSLPMFPSGGVLEARVTGGQVHFSDGRVHRIGDPHVTVTLRDVPFDLLINEVFKASDTDQISNALQNAFNFRGTPLTSIIARTELRTSTTGSITTMAGSIRLPDGSFLCIEICVYNAYVRIDVFGVHSSGAGDVRICITRRMQ